MKSPSPTASRADLTLATDYYPFGSAMPGRCFSAGEYRYGFQGQEKDDELKGEGNSVNYKYRIHDARIGRFFAVDPLAASFPWNSSYAFSENRVVDAVELEGLEKFRVTFTAFIPQNKVPVWFDPLQFILQGGGAYHGGDSREFYTPNPGGSFRGTLMVVLDFNDVSSWTYEISNSSTSYRCWECSEIIDESPAVQEAGDVNVERMSEDVAVINFSMRTKNLLAAGDNPFTPMIDGKATLTFYLNEDGTFNYDIEGLKVDGFPAFEMWVTNEDSNESFLLFARNPLETKETPFPSLFGNGEHNYDDIQGNSNSTPQEKKIFFEDQPNISEKK